MKRLIIFISLFLMCLTLSACDPSIYRFNLEELSENVVNVELINYDNNEQKHFQSWVPDHSDKLLPFDNSKETIIEELNGDKLTDFLNQLSEADVLFQYYAYDSPKDICIKLSYKNGDFVIISCNYKEKSFGGYIGKYSSDGKVLEFIGCFESYYYYESLVNDYFETKINFEQ